jgi:hypothetical protein
VGIQSVSDKALEMFGDLPDFPGSRVPKNRPSSKKQNSLLNDRFNGARYKIYRISGEDMQMFTIGQLAIAVNRKPVTIRMWESRGWIPKATYRTPAPKTAQIPNKSVKGRRLYSRTQVEFLLEAIQTFKLDTAQADWAGFANHTSKNYPK